MFCIQRRSKERPWEEGKKKTEGRVGSRDEKQLEWGWGRRGQDEEK